MNDHKEIDWERLNRMIQDRKGEKWALIPLLQEIQEVFNYIPPEAIELIARELNLFSSEVQGVVSFYSGFSMEPKGRYVLKVCRGTACHVKGGKSILNLTKKELNLEEGETGQDYQFTLETTACLGACALAPTMMVNKTYFGKLTPPKLINVITEYKSENKKSL
ncbi:NAD(P)H-dependent oxidoreductase subunit E [Thermodesulfobacteriota bacterium]